MTDCLACASQGLDHDEIVRDCLSSPLKAGRILAGFDWFANPLHQSIDEWHMKKINEGAKRIMILLPRGHMKCAKDQKVLTSAGTKKISELSSGDMIASCKVESFKNTWSKVLRCESNGEKSTTRVKTRSGRSIEVSDNHPIYRFDGWVESKNLSVGDRIAVARRYEEPTTDLLTDLQCSFLGHMVGDGSTTTNCTYSTQDCNEEFVDLCERLGFKTKVLICRGEYAEYSVSGGSRKFLRKHGVMGKSAHDKEVPSSVFASSFDSRIAFLRSYWNCDGTVGVKSKQISACTVSRALAESVASLLITVGIFSRVCECSTKYNGKPVGFFQVTVSGKDNIRRFRNLVRLIPRKQEKVDLLWAEIEDSIFCGTLDTVPAAWQDSMPDGWTVKTGFKSGRAYSTTRDKLARVAKVYPHLNPLAHGDVYWDEVVAVEDAGTQEVFDVEVEDTHNYYINDVLTHNTFYFGIATMLWEVINNPETRILYVMASCTQSAKTLESLTDIMQSSDAFKHFFPRQVLDSSDPRQKVTKEAIRVIRHGNYREGTVEARGRGSRITGGHFPRHIFDDLIDEDMVDSEVLQEQAINFVKRADPLFVNPGLDKRTIIGTRWPGPFYNWLLEPGGIAETYEKLVLGCYVDDRFHKFLASIGKKTTLPDGAPIWERFTEETLEAIRKVSHFDFSHQYLNIEVSDADRRFRKEDIKYYNIGFDRGEAAAIAKIGDQPFHARINKLYRTMTIDPATGENKRTDESAITVCGQDPNTGCVYVLDAWHGRVLPFDLINKIIEMAEKHDPHVVAPEDVSFQKTLKHFLKRAMTERGVHFPIRPVKPGSKSKGSRIIDALQPFIQNQQVFFLRNQHALVSELLNMQIINGRVVGKSPNLADSLAYHAEFWKRGPSAKRDRGDDIKHRSPWLKPNDGVAYGLQCLT